jgi:hypothetical protein
MLRYADKLLERRDSVVHHSAPAEKSAVWEEAKWMVY